MYQLSTSQSVFTVHSKPSRLM